MGAIHMINSFIQRVWLLFGSRLNDLAWMTEVYNDQWLIHFHFWMYEDVRPVHAELGRVRQRAGSPAERNGEVQEERGEEPHQRAEDLSRQVDVSHPPPRCLRLAQHLRQDRRGLGQFTSVLC